MAVKVQLKHLHISPRKVRLVADLVRGADVQEAEKILKFTFKKAAKPIEKLLKSAVATAKNDFSFEESNLFVSEIFVNEGATLKRWMPRAHGRAFPILKRTCHVVMSLDEKVKGKKRQEASKDNKAEKSISVKEIKTAEEKGKSNDDKILKKDFKDIDSESKKKMSDINSNKGIFKKVFRRKSG